MCEAIMNKISSNKIPSVVTLQFPFGFFKTENQHLCYLLKKDINYVINSLNIILISIFKYLINHSVSKTGTHEIISKTKFTLAVTALPQAYEREL